MTIDVLNQTPYLRTSREFPEDLPNLTREINKSYIDIATAVNNRTIGIYASNKSANTGDSWLITKNQKQQAFHQVYKFTAAGNIPHMINIINVSYVSINCYGSFTDGTNWYGAIYGSDTAIAGQVSFYITPNSKANLLDGNIVVLAGAGAPTITNGIIVIEWI